MSTPFQEAIEYAASRGVVLPSEYYGSLVGAQKTKATTIAGLASLEQIKFVIELVQKALEDGTTFTDFKKKVRTGALRVDLPGYRLDNIFRTNIQVAYNRGRWEQQKRNASSRPYLMYDAINDSRTRPNHTAMDGTILHRDDPWWRTHYPPCGYRCRCTVISLTEKQLQARGGVSPKGPDVDPDEGWDFNPGEDYQGHTNQALEDFGQDLIEAKPNLWGKVLVSKAKIKEASMNPPTTTKKIPKVMTIGPEEILSMDSEKLESIFGKRHLSNFKYYAGHGYGPINSSMRSGKPDKSAMLLKDSFKKAPVAGPEGFSVFRGVKLSPEATEKLKTPGAVWQDAGFQSTSLDLSLAEGFGHVDAVGSAVMKIKVKGGDRVIPIGNALSETNISSQGAKESEVLLEGRSYKVVGWSAKKKKIVVRGKNKISTVTIFELEEI